jgi:hypothetical protein
MNKTYSRKKTGSIALICLGLLISVSIFREKTFVVIYDGFFLICAILMLIMGLWGLMTPLVRINRTIVELKLSLFTTKTIDLKRIREIGYDKNKQILKFDSFEFKLKWMNGDYHKDFINDLRVLREQIDE